MFMVKFSPTALNFGYDFVILVYFFWDTLYTAIYNADVRDVYVCMSRKYLTFDKRFLFSHESQNVAIFASVCLFDTFYPHSLYHPDEV